MQVQRDSNGLQSKSVTSTTDSPQRPHFYLETKLDSNIKKKEYSKTYKLPRNPITPFLTHITSKNLQSTNHDNDDKEGKGKIKPPIVSFLFRPFLWRESHSLMSDSATTWTAAHQAPLFMGLSRQGHRNGWPFPFSWGSSQPRNWTWFSCVAPRFFTILDTREA